MAEQERNTPKDQLQLPDVTKQVYTKLLGIMATTDAQPDLFDPEPEHLRIATYPPGLERMAIAHRRFRPGIIGELVQKTGLEESALEARAQYLDHFVLGLPPTSEELQEARMHPEIIEQLYSRADIINGVRCISVVEDTRMIPLLLSMSDEQLRDFLDKLAKDQFLFFTSDKEMARLHGDVYRLKVNPISPLPDMPPECSAREAFFEECTDDYRNIEPNIDFPNTLHTLSEQYPHG